MEQLFDACHRYFEKTGRRISFEYAMIDGVNDNDWQADLIARKLQGMPGHVNLIPLNDVVESPFKPSRRVAAFQKRLESHGVTATVRRSLGGDIDASCGQLRRKAMEEKERRAPDMKMWGIIGYRSGAAARIRTPTPRCYGGRVTAPPWSATAWAAPTAAALPAASRWSSFEKELRAVLQEDAGDGAAAAGHAVRHLPGQRRHTPRGRRRTPTISTWAPHWCAPWPREDLVMVGNIGDSRAYHINGEGIRQISRDHSVVESMVETGQHHSPGGHAAIPDRNLITRALGPEIQAQADTFDRGVASRGFHPAVHRWAGEHRLGSGDAV